MEQIFGVVERITFYNLDNNFTVAKIKQPRKAEMTCVVGHLPDIKPGETVRLQGEWKFDAKHGQQFVATNCEIEAPSDVVGIQKYLESGMVRGIGPAYAKRIVKRFGEKTLQVIEQSPKRLLTIEGIGKKRLETIIACWQEQKCVRDVMVFLQKYGVSPAYAQRIYRAYGDETVERMQENPYLIAEHISGVGFAMADRIANQMGFPEGSTQRMDAGIHYLLTQLALDGHTCYPKEEFEAKAQEILEMDISSRIEALQEEKKIMLEEGFIWNKSLYMQEKGILREIRRICAGKSPLRRVDQEKAITWVEEILHIQLANKQKMAVSSALSEKFMIITGGPGTGKSTITKAILAITEKLTRKMVLAAPTGRAAKRLSEITRKEAVTIHSLLKYDFKKRAFRFNRDNPLECDLIVIDEASMIDTTLMWHLLRAIPNHARVLLIGDIHQLPSVGPGNVLKDLIESALVSTVELNEIFRQAKGSAIITNAHRINAGEFPSLKNHPKSDFFFLEKEEPEELLQAVVDLATKRLPQRYGFDPIGEIQVLAPMKRGVIGINNLNVALQKALNPHQEGVSYGGQSFSCHDKVMQIRNNYNKEVYNGDIGKIVSLDRAAQTLSVDYDGHLVDYLFSQLDEIQLAYATSIHKYQGSESTCVIIPVHTSHFMMLHRNLLYTGVTRGKKLVVLVGCKRAIGMAVKSDQVLKRHTGIMKFVSRPGDLRSSPPQEPRPDSLQEPSPEIQSPSTLPV